MHYFIEENGRKQGPFDMIAMLRRVRSGRLKRMDVIWLDWAGERVSAYQVPEFEEMFCEYEDGEAGNDVVPDAPANLSLGKLLKDGLEYIVQHVIITVITGALLFAILFGGGIIASLLPAMIGFPLACVWGFLLFALFQIGMLRINRMQIVTPDFFMGVLKRSGLSITIISTVSALLVGGIPVILATMLEMPWLMAWVFFPGSVLWFALFFAPMIAADRRIGALAAMGQSVKLLGRIGANNASVLFTVWMLNFIFGATGILLVITLPLTLIILCDVYDSHFNQYQE